MILEEFQKRLHAGILFRNFWGLAYEKFRWWTRLDMDHFLAENGVNMTLSYVGSNTQKCSAKKAILKNFAIFTGNRPCWSLFSIKLQALKPATLLNSCEYCKNFKNTYFEEQMRTATSVNWIITTQTEPLLTHFMTLVSFYTPWKY